MKALSIRQIWAWLIIYGNKDIENRTRRTHYRGELLIHAGKQWDPRLGMDKKNAASHIELERFLLDNGIHQLLAHKYNYSADTSMFMRGGVIGKVDLVDCVQDHQSGWAIPEMWHWVLKNPQPLPFYECRGQYGLFDITGIT